MVRHVSKYTINTNDLLEYRPSLFKNSTFFAEGTAVDDHDHPILTSCLVSPTSTQFGPPFSRPRDEDSSRPGCRRRHTSPRLASSDE